MKAVILAAGEGNRLRPITASRPKPMIPLLGKPLLEYIFIGLKEAGILDIILIVGYKEQVIKNHFDSFSRDNNIKIEYITQKEYLGTAHATAQARFSIKDESFLMMNGDLFVDSEVFKNLLQEYKKHTNEGFITLLEVDNPENYGVISLNSKGYVENITEKPSPDLGLGNLANAGIYIFNSSIFRAIEKTGKSIRKEYEITDSIRIAIKEFGAKFKGFILKNNFWNDIGLPWQLFEVNKYILDKLESKNLGIVEKNVSIKGNVYIGKDTIVKSGSYLQGPCYIGNNCLIGPNAFIRPYTSINDNCHIGMSEIKNSFVFSNSAVPHFNYVGDSIICEDVNLGAGTKLSNLRFDDQTIKMNINGNLIDSKRRKLGAILGPKSQTGINASIMCGKIIGNGSIIGAHTLVNENVPPNSLYYQDSNGKIIKKTNTI
ncbi:MAG: bifunctional sugar-1-phosphate nucleotidylyltransferase/acetyltransferase [Candidatus Hermodarchaeota archaeon]